MERISGLMQCSNDELIEIKACYDAYFNANAFGVFQREHVAG